MSDTPSPKFQSRFRNHMIPVRSATYEQIPGAGRRPIPGLYAKFRGPYRLFDPDVSARDFAWSDEDKETVINWLLGHKNFNRDFYLAPGSTIPEDKEHLVRNKKAEQKRRCIEAWVEGETVIQCKEEPMVGSDRCQKHARVEQKIVKGLATTAD